jgi:hypothetical protein
MTGLKKLVNNKVLFRENENRNKINYTDNFFSKGGLKVDNNNNFFKNNEMTIKATDKEILNFVFVFDNKKHL